MKKIYTVVGARPQFIKAAALTKEIYSNYKGLLKEEIIHTGQHFDDNMSASFFKELEIKPPKYFLNINQGTHGSNTGRMIIEIEKILLKDLPDGIVVYGDTNTTLAGAIAASKINIPIFHIEAGLRSFNRNQPEEQNRVLTDHLSDLCFGPTNQSIKNLIKESIQKKRIIKSGDIMADTLRIFKEKSNNSNFLLEKFNLKSKNFILFTLHRQENVENRYKLYEILEGLKDLSLPIIFPIHPRTKNKITEFNLTSFLNEMIITEPLGFLDMMFLERNAFLILTDSGGIQKEAYLQKTPCITLREETEWIELIENGWNKLANPLNSKNIKSLINLEIGRKLKRDYSDIYGRGFTAKLILDSILDYLSKKD